MSLTDAASPQVSGIHHRRRLDQATSAWVRSFSCAGIRPLIICRGPVRKEALDIFAEMGISDCGILLSDKDSVVYSRAQAPELRQLKPSQVHRVPDYSGVDAEERRQRIAQIVAIARQHGYDSIFAGYGFMAEDEEMVAAMERAGLRFIGPCSAVIRDAGLKDQAKRTALELDVSVTPGVDDVTTRTLLAAHPDVPALERLAREKGLLKDELAAGWGQKAGQEGGEPSLEERAGQLLAAALDAGVELFSTEELCQQVVVEARQLFERHPGNRLRLKAIAGGGGKGQRLLPAPSSMPGDSDRERAAQAAAQAPALVREVLAEVKATGPGDNRNLLIELNVEDTRHFEVQLLGNGDWCVNLGARDCSVQMYEQKLLEVSLVRENLEQEISRLGSDPARQEAGSPPESASLAAGSPGSLDAPCGPEARQTLEADLRVLQAMEEQSMRFGAAVGLDSASTFECIVEADRHYFMEVNTRIQVEHRVSELCYSLRFANPEQPDDYFEVDSVVQAMVVLACHGPRLPRPERRPRFGASAEARLNATNAALAPHAGGQVQFWSPPVAGEIRDDQGISQPHPDTGAFIPYTLAGAYDSNIALLLSHGENRLDSYLRLAELLRRTELRGADLETNLDFHYGLVNWFIGHGVHARPTTRFTPPYLAAVGRLAEEASSVDIAQVYRAVQQRYLQAPAADEAFRQAVQEVFEARTSLLLRPLERLVGNPHLLAGWLGLHRADWQESGSGLALSGDPQRLLAALYRYLHMEYAPERPAAHVIWEQDRQLLEEAGSFYRQLAAELGEESFAALARRLASGRRGGISAGRWTRLLESHLGFQAGMELLLLPAWLGRQAGFEQLRVRPDLGIEFAEEWLDPEFQGRMRELLAPAPEISGDELVAPTGGMFYLREAPDQPSYVEVGSHFEKGDPLYIIEVMKMFNKVYAPFPGTIAEVLVEGDGVIVNKGQSLFKVVPDQVAAQSVDPGQRRRQIEQRSLQVLEGLDWERSALHCLTAKVKS